MLGWIRLDQVRLGYRYISTSFDTSFSKLAKEPNADVGEYSGAVTVCVRARVRVHFLRKGHDTDKVFVN